MKIAARASLACEEATDAALVVTSLIRTALCTRWLRMGPPAVRVADSNDERCVCQSLFMDEPLHSRIRVNATLESHVIQVRTVCHRDSDSHGGSAGRSGQPRIQVIHDPHHSN